MIIEHMTGISSEEIPSFQENNYQEKPFQPHFGSLCPEPFCTNYVGLGRKIPD
jgi:hypothetical protein